MRLVIVSQQPIPFIADLSNQNCLGVFIFSLCFLELEGFWLARPVTARHNTRPFVALAWQSPLRTALGTCYAGRS